MKSVKLRMNPTKSNKLDIIVFSRHRNKELSQSISVWNSLPYNFIILHNSDKPIVNINLGSNIQYKFLPRHNYGQRAKVASSLLTQDFSMILSDDERIIPSGLDCIIKALIKDESFATVGGKVLGVYRYGTTLTGLFTYKNMYNYKNYEHEILPRLYSHLTKPINNGYAIGGMYRVMRRKDMISMLNLFDKCSFIQKQTPFIYEIVGEFACATFGTTKTIDKVYWIRNWKTRITDTAEWRRKDNFFIWWTTNNYPIAKLKLLEILSSFASISIEETEKIISGYIKLRGNPKERRVKSHLEVTVRAKIRKMIPNFIIRSSAPISLIDTLKNEELGSQKKDSDKIVQVCEEMLNSPRRIIL